MLHLNLDFVALGFSFLFIKRVILKSAENDKKIRNGNLNFQELSINFESKC